MNTRPDIRRWTFPLGLLLSIAAVHHGNTSFAQAVPPQDRAAAIKQSLADNQAQPAVHVDRDHRNQFERRGQEEGTEAVLGRAGRQGPEDAASRRRACTEAAGAAVTPRRRPARRGRRQGDDRRKQSRGLERLHGEGRGARSPARTAESAEDSGGPGRRQHVHSAVRERRCPEPEGRATSLATCSPSASIRRRRVPELQGQLLCREAEGRRCHAGRDLYRPARRHESSRSGRGLDAPAKNVQVKMTNSDYKKKS